LSDFGGSDVSLLYKRNFRVQVCVIIIKQILASLFKFNIFRNSKANGPKNAFRALPVFTIGKRVRLRNGNDIVHAAALCGAEELSEKAIGYLVITYTVLVFRLYRRMLCCF
jgi:hypothetical protein